MAEMINLPIQLCCGNSDCPLLLLSRMRCEAQWLNAIIKFLVCKGGNLYIHTVKPVKQPLKN